VRGPYGHAPAAGQALPSFYHLGVIMAWPVL